MPNLFKATRHVHFVGIGGIGMSGIAEVLLTLGHRVSGSDISESDAVHRLRLLGAHVTIGHSAAAIGPHIDVVVISSAVRYANPEVVQARALKIPVIPRAEMLAELMRMKWGIAVAGTHGKTTTTSLIAAILRRANLDPTVVIGGRLHSMGTNAQLGHGDLMVTEADESDGTFLLLSPAIAVITNIDPEHLDYYGDMDRVKSAYLEFANRVPFYGAAVVCLDHTTVRALVPQMRKRVITYGTTSEADFVARDVAVMGMSTHFEVAHRRQSLGEITVRMPGRHHALNALAATAVAMQLDVPLDAIRDALAEFGGIHRRFEVCGEAGGVLVVSDYGHHPEEIRATIAAAREGFGRRIVVVFQPHRYTRTRDLFGDFLDAFDAADQLVLTEVYAAGEPPIDGVTSEVLFWALKRRGHLEVSYVPQREHVVAEVQSLVRAGDLVLILGAGNIHDAGEQLVRALAGSQNVWTMQ
ncbi:MAG TPA: UDP-N-acetylmuramate--L-alanine ligase [Candidatus Binatia bacterium]|nr:UDP-N-acetylmuramate--L-alanine ligase [Candidatus Binatia bacterium]